jgi:predicted MFS family arabinose efflux permease
MAVPRIFSGRAFLDKLPYWLALPAGVFIGLFVGYRASMPEVGMKRMALAAVVLFAVVLCASLVPRPARRRAQHSGQDQGQSQGAKARATAHTDDDSLCG